MHGTQLLDVEPVVERTRDMNDRVRKEVVARPVPARVVERETGDQRLEAALICVTGVSCKLALHVGDVVEPPESIDPSVEHMRGRVGWILLEHRPRFRFDDQRRGGERSGATALSAA